MTVYVDTLRNTTPTKKWRHSQACHMIADSTEELQEFAGRLKLLPWWMSDRGKATEHYDLTPAKREEALASGAVEVSSRQLVELIREKRERMFPDAVENG